jgi:hypothetical protein
MSDPNTNETQSENPYQVAGEKKSSSSCCLYGCLGVFLLTAIVVVGGGFGAYWWFTAQVKRYTADAPANLPVVELSDEELAAIQARIDAFKETIEAGDTPEDLVLTAQELNALITQDEDMRGKVFVRIADGEVSGDVSIPTDFLPGGKGRFFNASATFEVSLENGVLIVTLQDAEVKGEKLPQQFIDGMGQENLAKDAYKDPEVAATLRRIESISIENDKIVLKPRVAKSEGEVVEEGAGEGQPATDDSALPKESPESPSNEPPETEAVTPEEAKAPAPAE